jgi:hypothetical protein
MANVLNLVLGLKCGNIAGWLCPLAITEGIKVRTVLALPMPGNQWLLYIPTEPKDFDLSADDDAWGLFQGVRAVCTCSCIGLDDP